MKNLLTDGENIGENIDIFQNKYIKNTPYSPAQNFTSELNNKKNAKQRKTNMKKQGTRTNTPDFNNEKKNEGLMIRITPANFEKSQKLLNSSCKNLKSSFLNKTENYSIKTTKNAVGRFHTANNTYERKSLLTKNDKFILNKNQSKFPNKDIFERNND